MRQAARSQWSARETWLKKLPAAPRRLVEILYQQLEAVREIQKRAEREMLAEARRHRIWRVLMSCPGTVQQWWISCRTSERGRGRVELLGL